MSTQVQQGKYPSTFPKSEKLCSEKAIQSLFKGNKSIFLYPFKLYFFQTHSQDQLFPKVLFSVPKKNFKSAVVRNHIKRKLREAYRLNKGAIFFGENNVSFLGDLALIYIAKENISFHDLQEKLISILYRLKNSRNV